MPASRAFATMRDEVASSAGPPNIMVPRQIGEIFRPLRPSLRYCIGWVLHMWPSLRAQRSNPSGGEGRMDCFVASAPRNDGNGSGIALQYLKHARRHRDTA